MLLDPEHERLAAENTQAQAEIVAALPLINPLMVDGVIPAGQVASPLSRPQTPIYQGSSNEHFRIW